MIPNAWAGFDFGLGADIDMLRKTVSGFAQDRIAPRADAIDRDNVFPRDLWPEMGALGLHGITVEEEYGGSSIALPWKKFRGRARRWGCPMARIRISASINSAATGATRRNANIFRN